MQDLLTWVDFSKLQTVGFTLKNISTYYRKYKEKRLSHEDFEIICKKSNKKEILKKIRNVYFEKENFQKTMETMETKKPKETKEKTKETKNPQKTVETKNPQKTVETKNPQKTVVEEININFKIEKTINNDELIAMCEKFINKHLLHISLIKNNITERFYELARVNHKVKIKKKEVSTKLYILNIDKPWGKQNLACIDGNFNLYRIGSSVKLGNIEKDEFYFVRGKLAYFYIGKK